ncbi:MAG: transcriptional repressor [Planctomycetota bacterium]|nr:transcriptional repressor [Planctomycetota bacterium]
MRKSRQREAVRSALLAAGRPLTPQEVHAEAERAVEGLGIATVYRHLNALEEGGEVVRLDGFGKGGRYEAAHTGHHHHFHCRDCDRVYDVERCPGQGRIESLAPKGFVVEAHEVTLYGTCAECGSS